MLNHFKTYLDSFESLTKYIQDKTEPDDQILINLDFGVVAPVAYRLLQEQLRGAVLHNQIEGLHEYRCSHSDPACAGLIALHRYGKQTAVVVKVPQPQPYQLTDEVWESLRTSIAPTAQINDVHDDASSRQSLEVLEELRISILAARRASLQEDLDGLRIYYEKWLPKSTQKHMYYFTNQLSQDAGEEDKLVTNARHFLKLYPSVGAEGQRMLSSYIGRYADALSQRRIQCFLTYCRAIIDQRTSLMALLDQLRDELLWKSVHQSAFEASNSSSDLPPKPDATAHVDAWIEWQMQANAKGYQIPDTAVAEFCGRTATAHRQAKKRYRAKHET